MERSFRLFRHALGALLVVSAFGAVASLHGALPAVAQVPPTPTPSPRPTPTPTPTPTPAPTPTPTPAPTPTPTPAPTPTPTPAPVPTRSPRPLARGIAPPTLIYPVMAVPAVNPPVVFAWTPVNGATSYELQISDSLDVRSRVLVDATLFGTTYTFSNIPDGAFTPLQPAGVPLSGGPLFWRVRALGPNSATIFSSIARLTLGNISSGMPLHNLAVASIGIAGNPIAGIPSAILVRIENRGSFPAAGAYLTVTVNGRSLGAAEQVKPLRPGDVDYVTLAWNPADSGITSVVAALNYADDVPASKLGELHVAVEQQKGIFGAFTGIVGGACGSYTLKDSRGNTIAQLVPTPGAPLTTLLPLYDRRASIQGTLTIGAQGPQIAVQSAARASAQPNPHPRNPCSPKPG